MPDSQPYDDELAPGTLRHLQTQPPQQETGPGGITGRKEKTMSNQEIFDMLADNEERLCYAYWANPTEELKAAHEAAKAALEAFARATGCRNQ